MADSNPERDAMAGEYAAAVNELGGALYSLRAAATDLSNQSITEASAAELDGLNKSLLFAFAAISRVLVPVDKLRNSINGV